MEKSGNDTQNGQIVTKLTNNPKYKLAYAILGKDFISPEDVMNSRKGITYTEEQLTNFSETIPAQQIIKWCRDNNYMLVAGPNIPMSLLDIRDLKSDYFYIREYGWYASNKKFSQNDKVETVWCMVRKDVVPKSISKNWEEQQSLISDVEIIPNAAEFIWVITTYKAVRDIYLFGGIYARTSSLDSDEYYVYIGCFGDEGLAVSYYWYDTSNCILGLSVARK